MTIFKHTCLDGEDRLGQETDCPKCRALLLDAFRTVPRLPHTTEPVPAGPVASPFDRPHLIVPESSARTVELPHPEEHAAQHGISSTGSGGGGVWWATCICGWSDGGRYMLPGAETAALRVAKDRADDHEANPERDQ